MLIDREELWNSIAVNIGANATSDPITRISLMLKEIVVAPKVEAIPVEWIESYIEKKQQRFEDVRRLGGDAEFILKKIDTIEEMLEAFRSE